MGEYIRILGDYAGHYAGFIEDYRRDLGNGVQKEDLSF